MMDYQYRRMAHELATKQRDDIINDANKEMKQTVLQFEHFIKKATLSIVAFFQSLH